MEEFTRSIQDIGSDLTVLGNGVKGGVKAFAQVTQLTAEQEVEYRKLGITQEKYNKFAVDYVKTQSALGRSSLGTVEEQKAGTKRYMDTLNELSAVTGIQRDALVKEQEALAMDVQFQARQRELRQKGAEGVEQAEREMAIVAALTAKGGKDVGKAAMEIAVNGRATSAQAAQTAVLFNGELERTIQEYSKSGGNLGESLGKIGKSADKSIDQFGQALKLGGSNVMGITGQTVKGIGNLASTSAISYKEELEKQKKEKDDLAKGDVDKTRAERTAQRQAEDLTNIIAKRVNPAMGQLANGMEGLIKTLREKAGGKDMERNADRKLDRAENYVRSKVGAKPKGYDDPSKDIGDGVYKRSAKDQTAASGKQTSDTGNLNIKSAESTAGGKVDEKVVQLTQKAVDEFTKQGVSKVVITALNDKWHKDNKLKSKHSEGKAVDLTVNPAPKDEEQSKIYAEALKKIGFNKVLDEYFHPSPGSTGGHFHAELAKGGITQGVSIAGEAGPEAVVPLPDGRTIPVKITKDESDKSGDMKAFMDTLSTANQDSSRLMSELMTTMGDKMDTMITYLKASAGHQEDLVINARNS
jgi:D-alanyl-D-alanine dipeptidase